MWKESKEFQIVKRIIIAGIILGIIGYLFVTLMVISSHGESNINISGHYGILKEHGQDMKFGWIEDSAMTQEYLSVAEIKEYVVSKEGIYLNTSDGYQYFDYENKQITKCDKNTTQDWITI